MSLNSTQRTATLAATQAVTYDLLVIGGGITGAGIALDAASRGLKTLLVEMQDFGAGTSSRSTKLIHGGLRYLKQFEFKLVREVGRERAILFRNAPHIVIPEKMLLPVYRGGSFNRLSLRFGLWFYDRLAGVKRSERRKMLNRAQTMVQEPLLSGKNLQGAGIYSEYRTDDARLVIEVIKTAVREGATALNYCRAEELTYADGKVTGAQVRDLVTDASHQVRAQYVVNAAGPWVDGIRKLDGSEKGKRLHHTKGVHLVVPHKRLPLRQATYIDAPDGRMVFIIPRQLWTYIGTTDTSFKGDLAHPRTTAADVRYLLEATNTAFSEAKITQADISSTWAGIRPLIHEEGKSPSELSRKDEIFYSDTGLVTIAGGKLTGFRKMAEKVVDVVAERMNRAGGNVGRCVSDQIGLEGGSLGNRRSLAEFVEHLQRESGVARKEVEWLAGLFGSNARQILDWAAELEGEEELRITRAAVRYAVEHEGARTLGDFFIRRSALLYFGREWIAPVLDLVADELRTWLGDDHVVDPEQEFARMYREVVEFPKDDFAVAAV
ncbi:MAG: glycerol-3-phosphate dehydrogenase/oxidase [Bacteroidota bacterium]